MFDIYRFLKLMALGCSLAIKRQHWQSAVPALGGRKRNIVYPDVQGGSFMGILL